jgi:LETM1 and EF-hand domain-containing protein 1
LIDVANSPKSARPRFPGALGAASTANLRFNGRGLPSHVQAIALLVSHQRGYATEQSTSHSNPSDLPPPGFNAEQAKKPIPSNTEQSTDRNQQLDRRPDQSVASKADGKSTPDTAVSKASEENKKVTEEKKEQKKLTIGQKIKKEAQHYWDGTKLLATEVRISSRLALKMAAGYELSRREHRQVSRHTLCRTLVVCSANYSFV